MTRPQHLALTLFAIGMIGLGILALIYGDFALVWQPVAAWFPARTTLAYTSGIMMLLGGLGLLVPATRVAAICLLFPYLLIWLLLKVPSLVVAPQMEAVWLGFGELAVLFAGGWTLFAIFAKLRPSSPLSFLTGPRSLHLALLFMGLWLLPIGLSHIMYVTQTAQLVPAWLHFRIALAYLTGAGQILCGLLILFTPFRRFGAALEAALITSFALLVWLPAVVARPNARLPWTAFFITWAIAAAAWVVASYAENRTAAVRAPTLAQHAAQPQ